MSGADGPDAAAQREAERIVARMLERDAFSRWLGVVVTEVAPGRCTARMTVRADMVNGFGVCHGGATFALADSALAFACNSRGGVTMSIDNSIGYPAPAHVDDVLTAVAELETASRRVGFYRVRVVNQRGDAVALFRGTVYDTGRPHGIDQAPASSS